MLQEEDVKISKSHSKDMILNLEGNKWKYEYYIYSSK